MSLEPIGIASLLVGIICLFLGNEALVQALAITSVLGAAAAMLIGPANIPPAHVLVGFLALGVLTRRRESIALLQAFKFGRPAFWLALLVFYGLLSAYFAPRLLTGATDIIPLGGTIYPQTGSTVPLVPVSTNLTQSLYMIGNIICFGLVVSVASNFGGFQAVLVGIIGYCIANVIFAILDITTASVGADFLLNFIRNAQYTLHTDEQVAGSKRIVGSFTETSSFARSSLGVIGFSGTLWLCGYRPMLNGLVAICSLALVVASTSSTGLAGAPVVLAILYTTSLFLSGRSSIRGYVVFMIVIVPMVAIVVVLWILIDPYLTKIIYNYIDIIVLGKAGSDSGITRSSWNQAGIRNFFDTYGIGVGLGTNRTSSFIVALLSNVGVVGTLMYLAFFYTALIAKRGVSGSFTRDVRLAAQNGCLSLIVGDMLISSAIDQGLFFYILAALASSTPEHKQQKEFVPSGEAIQRLPA